MRETYKIAVLLAAGLACSLEGSPPANRSAQIEWLSRNAVQIRSIDPTVADDDFNDLKPLIRAIGNARVVVLGEQSHGDGATFLAKGRLIKFLHQRMGFDVLAWEAGLFNCWDMDAAVRDRALPVEEAMGRGLYPIWALSAQVKPVFEYARSVAGTKRPLEMIGVDHQFSGTGGAARWRDAMVAFVDKADPTLLSEPLRSSLLRDLIVWKPDSSAASIRAVAEKWRALPTILDAARARLESTHSARDVALMRRTADDALFSLEGSARIREAAGQFKAADSNMRDKRMGETLVWLANERYRGRRVIVWAAMFHALHDPSAIKLGPGAGFSYENVLTMGQVARTSLGAAIYTIGFTAADGTAGDVTGGRKLDLKVTNDGSFEDLSANVGSRFLFLDLRTLPNANWLRRPTKARPLGYSPIETDWTRQMDAFVFTRTMFPSTKGPMAPDGVLLTDGPSRPRAARHD